MENRLEPSIFFPQIHLKRDLCTPIAVQRSHYTEQTEPQTPERNSDSALRSSASYRIHHSVALIAGICTLVVRRTKVALIRKITIFAPSVKLLKRLKERVESSGDIPYIWVSSGLLFLFGREWLSGAARKKVFFNQRYIQDSMAYNYITQEGYDKILAELAELESVQRPEISRQIAEARDKGDLSENAEYDAAKEAQGILETKIAQLKGLIANARIIDESQVSTESVQILNKVTIKNVKTGVVMAYTLVSDSEANLKENKISVNTPIAQGLMGKKIGDLVSIKVPSGLVEFEIIDITL